MGFFCGYSHFLLLLVWIHLCNAIPIDKYMLTSQENNIIHSNTTQNIIVNTSNTTVFCDDNYQICNITCLDCTHSYINCSSSLTDCFIHCISNNSCSNSVLTVPYVNTQYNISLQCIGYSSCKDSTILSTNMNTVDIYCDFHSCFNLIGQFDYSNNVIWHCYHGGCQFVYISVPNVFQFILECYGNKTSSENNGNVIATCWKQTISATQANRLNISCIESYSCGNLVLYPPQVKQLYILSSGYNALYGMDIYYPSDETYINITCIAMIVDSYSCSYINIYGDEYLLLKDTHFNCIGTGCGGNFYIESKYGLNDINFSLDSQCICGSVASCVGNVYTIFDLDLLWNIIGGTQECNYSVQIVKEPDVDSYNELICEMVNVECSSSQTEAFCNNCSQYQNYYSNICCGSFINSLQTSFEYYYNIHNCTTTNHTANPRWFYPVIVLLLGFVATCLIGIWCKNNWRQKEREKYEKMIQRQRYSLNGTTYDDTNTATSTTSIKPPGYINYNVKIIQTIENKKGQSLLAYGNNNIINNVNQTNEIINNEKEIQNNQIQTNTHVK
eukprot:242346_1